MPQHLYQVVLPDISGVAEDSVLNGYVVSTEAADPIGGGAVDYFCDGLINLYNGANTNQPVAAYLGASRSRTANAAKIFVYDITGHLNGSAHGNPVFMKSWTLGAVAAGAPLPLPNEVAVVLSFRGSYTALNEENGPIHERARHRGRVFLGPVNSSVSAILGSKLVVSEAARIDIAQAAKRFVDYCEGLATPSFWAVWSRKNASLAQVIAGWVDDAFDTQRRRGAAATVRTNWAT